MFSGLLLFIVSVPLAIAAIVVSAVVATASIATTIAVNEDQKKHAEFLAAQRLEDQIQENIYDRESYNIALEKHRKLEFLKFNLNNLKEWYKYKYTLQSYINNPEFVSNCAYQYKKTGQVPKLCRSQGFDENQAEYAKNVEAYEAQVAHFNKVKLLAGVAFFVITIIVLTMYKEELKSVIK